MGFLSEIKKQVQNPLRRDGAWYTRQPTDAWKYYKDKLEAKSGSVAPPEVVWAADLGRRLTPGAANPLWNGVATQTEKALRNAGMSPVAAAAAAARVGNRARLDIADAAKGFYESVTRSQTRLSDQANAIQTTSPDMAYFSGFTAGGGAQGVSNLIASSAAQNRGR